MQLSAERNAIPEFSLLFYLICNIHPVIFFPLSVPFYGTQLFNFDFCPFTDILTVFLAI